jgi:hypothetical protein
MKLMRLSKKTGQPKILGGNGDSDGHKEMGNVLSIFTFEMPILDFAKANMIKSQNFF